MLIVTINEIPGKKLEALGVVRGSTVQSRNLGHDIMAGFRTLVGGEVTDYADTHGIRRPDSKIGSLVPIQFHGMCSQLFIDCIMNACGKTIHVFLRDLRNMAVCISTDFSVGCMFFRLTVFHHIFIR